jgi:predicted transcriptional regulator
MQKPIALRASEAACLEALRSGTDRKTLIALRAGLDLRRTQLDLETLASSGLAAPNGDRTWHLTPRGKRVDISIAAACWRRLTGLDVAQNWRPCSA